MINNKSAEAHSQDCNILEDVIVNLVAENVHGCSIEDVNDLHELEDDLQMYSDVIDKIHQSKNRKQLIKAVVSVLDEEEVEEILSDD